MSDASRADALLATLSDSGRGRLTVFLGAAPGVGKTYAMLTAAQQRQQQGVKVLIGVVETHGRSETADLLVPLTQLPRRHYQHHGHSLDEFDLDAALEAHPPLLLVDELAHTNVPGSRHDKRYQDVEELLAAGIDVYTTLNIQHLASLSDLVAELTGVQVRELVPDTVLASAYDVILVDLPPRALLERLKEGKVYVPEQARAAMSAFFTYGNLAALRELTLQAATAYVDRDAQLHRQASGERNTALLPLLLVALSPHVDGSALVRAGQRMASQLRCPWHVAHVGRGEPAEQIAQALSLATRLGAITVNVNSNERATAILDYAREQKATSILVGHENKGPWWWPWRTPLHLQLTAASPVDVVVAQVGSARAASPSQTPARHYLLAVTVMVAITAVSLLLSRWLQESSLLMVYLAGVLLAAVRTGIRPALLAAILAFANYNFWFTEPRYSLHMASQRDLATALAFLLIAAVTGQQAARLRSQMKALRLSNSIAQRLLQFGRQLAQCTDESGLLRSGVLQLAQYFDTPTMVVRVGPQQQVTVAAHSGGNDELSSRDQTAARWAWEKREAAGFATDTLNSADYIFVPLAASAELADLVIGLHRHPRLRDPASRAQLQAWLELWAPSLARARLSQKLETEHVKRETEELRSALLSSVSHDLRSPLTAMMGSAETWLTYHEKLPLAEQRTLIDGIARESKRLARYVQHLLDMTRLGRGSMPLERSPVRFEELWLAVRERLGERLAPFRLEVRLDRLPTLWIHAALIEQALVNIIENACQWAPPGTTIRVQALQAGDWVQIDISDEGPGIPPELREQVFELFFSARKGDTGQGGSGLGLAIAKGMITAHGGRIRALAGANNYGTRMRIMLPIALNSEPATSP